MHIPELRLGDQNEKELITAKTETTTDKKISEKKTQHPVAHSFYAQKRVNPFAVNDGQLQRQDMNNRLSKKMKVSPTPPEVICLSDDDDDEIVTDSPAVKSSTTVKLSDFNQSSLLNGKDDLSNWPTIQSKDIVQIPELPSSWMNVIQKPMTIKCTTVRFGIVEFQVEKESVFLKESEIEMKLKGLSKGRSLENLNIKLAYSDVVQFIYSYQSRPPVALIQVRKEFAELFEQYIPSADEKGLAFDPTSKGKKILCLNIHKHLFSIPDERRRRILLQLKPVSPDVEKNNIPVIYHYLKLRSPRMGIAYIVGLRSQELYNLSRFGTPSSSSGTQAPTMSPSDLIQKTVCLNHGQIRFDLTRDDLMCLNEAEFLNDTIIDFYLQYIYYELLSDDDRKRTYLFNSFFYTRLTKKGNDDDSTVPASVRRYNRVKRWLRDVDIFEKDFLIIPINQHAHWYLAIICFHNSVETDADLLTSDDTSSTSSTPQDTTSKSNTSISISNHTVQQTSTRLDSTKKKSGEDVCDHLPLSSNERVVAGCISIDASDDADEAQADVTLSEDENLMTTNNNNCTDDSNSIITTSKSVKCPCIIIFDSLKVGSKARVVATLREFLVLEYEHKKLPLLTSLTQKKRYNCETIKGIISRVPQQPNFYDCGLYVLQYAECFFKYPLINFKSADVPTDWYDKEIMNSKRKQILNVINQHILTVKEENTPNGTLSTTKTSQISNNYRNQRGSNMANNKNDTTFEMLVTYLEKRYPTYSKDAITCALLKYRQQQSTLTGIPLARIEQEVLAIVAKDNDAPIISENKQEENHAKSEPEQLLLPSQYFGVHYENSDVNNVQEQKPTVASILWETFNRHRRICHGFRHRRQIANDRLVNPNFKPGTGSAFQGLNNNKNAVDQQAPPSDYVGNINYDNQQQQHFGSNQRLMNNQQQFPMHNNQQPSLNNPPQNFAPVQQQMPRDGNLQQSSLQRINQQQPYQNYPQQQLMNNQGQQQFSAQFPSSAQQRLSNQQELPNTNQQQALKAINNQQPVPAYNPNIQNFPQNPMNNQQSQQLNQNYPSDLPKNYQQQPPPIYTDPQNFPRQQQQLSQSEQLNPGLRSSNNNNKGGNVFPKSNGIYRSGSVQPSPFATSGWFSNNNNEWFSKNGYYVGDSQSPMSLTDKVKNVVSTGQLVLSKIAKIFLSKGEKSYPKYEPGKEGRTVCSNSENFNGFTFGHFPCPLPDTDPNVIFCCGPKNRQYCCNAQEYNAEQRYGQYGFDGRLTKSAKINKSKTVVLATVLPILGALLIIGIGTIGIMKYLRWRRVKTYQYNSYTSSPSSRKSDQIRSVNERNLFAEYERQPDGSSTLRSNGI
ncbi:unnamed protein product [Didymodactylos carnosus]|uniref:Ubiquitin-like protease family profile domain-containing protein n=1 Tax=Didymodactylos carnosus TaxID=1234261 RepID=A0A814IIM3_9BILA|nr:unnamed protein product [Didymodactylos carnosus]CAF1023246.1 unnamed protein product [Didymodactylos carnosus]CAF3637676.1 unnamed protein product [Didymodactylos carnosus]CAF3794560.1 unnamed protein product [Didymodactylos carnosus]